MADGTRVAVKVRQDEDDMAQAWNAFSKELRNAVRGPPVGPPFLGVLLPKRLPKSTVPKLVHVWAEGESLHDLFYSIATLREWTGDDSDKDLWSEVRDIIQDAVDQVIKLMHAANWVHGDISEGNVLLVANPREVLDVATTSGEVAVEVSVVDWETAQETSDLYACQLDICMGFNAVQEAWKGVLDLEDDVSQ